jgi:hypothetical protein
MHLLPTRGGPTVCGADGEASADINDVDCQICLAIHDAHVEEYDPDTQPQRD